MLSSGRRVHGRNFSSERNGLESLVKRWQLQVVLDFSVRIEETFERKPVRVRDVANRGFINVCVHRRGNGV